jgi:antirestriction protein
LRSTVAPFFNKNIKGKNMSRHKIEHSQYEIAIGWDRALNTFFCTVSDPEAENDKEKMLIGMGTDVGEYQNARQFLEEVKQRITKHDIADIVFPDSFVERLKQEQRDEGEGFQERSSAIRKWVLENQKKLKSHEIPRIYVADIADEEAGIYNGIWIEIDRETTKDFLLENIKRMLNIKGHTKWAVRDYENLPDALGESPDLTEVLEVARAVIEYGLELITGFLSVFSREELNTFNNRFLGLYSSLKGYGYKRINDAYHLREQMGSISQYFDYERFARDLEFSGDIVTMYVDTGILAVFDASEY